MLIAGFIITGNEPKKVILRGIGPSLTLGGALADPTLELRGGDGSLIRANDNWKTTQRNQIEATGVAPTSDLESAIVATLAPGTYSAILAGKSGRTGVGVVEIYDLNSSKDSKLVNISSRGFVETGSNVMIGGFIIGGGTDPTKVVLRAIGPTLASAGIQNPLDDPTLDLRDANGARLRFNDNWQDNAQQAAEITAAGLAPRDPRESAVALKLSAGSYTAIVAGKNGSTGVALFELYNLR